MGRRYGAPADFVVRHHSPDRTLAMFQPMLGEDYPFYDWFPRRIYGIMGVTAFLIVILTAGCNAPRHPG
jgi:hypothetical protein